MDIVDALSDLGRKCIFASDGMNGTHQLQRLFLQIGKRLLHGGKGIQSLDIGIAEIIGISFVKTAKDCIVDRNGNDRNCPVFPLSCFIQGHSSNNKSMVKIVGDGLHEAVLISCLNSMVQGIFQRKGGVCHARFPLFKQCVFVPGKHFDSVIGFRGYSFFFHSSILCRKNDICNGFMIFCGRKTG